MKPIAKDFRIGTAAWSVPKASAPKFPSEGSHLEKYSRRLNCAEINSAFYRDHKPGTYAKWAGMVPAEFKFAVKLSRKFTHEHRLDTTSGLAEVLEGISQLEEKLGVVLVQLPPSLNFEPKIARKFFSALRKLHSGNIALEPRHLTWVSEGALKLFSDFKIAKVVADPERCPLDHRPSTAGFQYYRLHGSPEVYRSDYEPARLRDWLERLRSEAASTVWCIFDNTALGFATENALQLKLAAEGGDHSNPSFLSSCSHPQRKI